MKADNIIQSKSYSFALKIIEVYKQLHQDKEFDLSSQLLRSGTSTGANVEEAIGAHSKKDFLSKMTIAYKEARETKYWLRLLTDSQILNSDQVRSMFLDIEEILKIIGSIQRSVKGSINS
ncbi:MAG: four helix bundle protein [Bacteroidota bacterium]